MSKQPQTTMQHNTTAQKKGFQPTSAGGDGTSSEEFVYRNGSVVAPASAATRRSLERSEIYAARADDWKSVRAVANSTVIFHLRV